MAVRATATIVGEADGALRPAAPVYDKRPLAISDTPAGPVHPPRRRPRPAPEGEPQPRGLLFKLYYTDDGYGMPVLAFKSATVDATRLWGKAVSMVLLKMSMFYSGVPSKDRMQLLTPLTEHSEPKMREDVVRLKGGGADLRYRAEFEEWRAVLDVTYVTSVMDRNSVLSLIDAAGMGVGVGEWRPM